MGYSVFFLTKCKNHLPSELINPFSKKDKKWKNELKELITFSRYDEIALFSIYIFLNCLKQKTQSANHILIPLKIHNENLIFYKRQMILVHMIAKTFLHN